MREYLKTIRTERNESMQQVAKSLGITRQYYEMIERGERKKCMDVWTLYRLSDHFQVPLDHMIKRELEWRESTGGQGT